MMAWRITALLGRRACVRAVVAASNCLRAAAVSASARKLYLVMGSRFSSFEGRPVFLEKALIHLTRFTLLGTRRLLTGRSRCPPIHPLHTLYRQHVEHARTRHMQHSRRGTPSASQISQSATRVLGIYGCTPASAGCTGTPTTPSVNGQCISSAASTASWKCACLDKTMSVCHVL